jgi:tetratricopeptide (TPR) repeat protein
VTVAITLFVAAAAVVKLPPRRARLIGPPPVNPEVTALLYQGAVAQSRQSYQGFADAITYFERAIAIQPDLAQAYSAMSVSYIQFSYVGPLAPAEFMPKAQEAAQKALELDPGFAEAHVTRAIVLYRYHWNWSEAESEFRRALELSPDYSDGHRTYAEFLAAAGRPDEGLMQSQRARELDSRPVQTLLQSAAALRAAGHYDQAVGAFREALDKAPELSRAHFQLGITYVYKGELSEALDQLEAAVRLAPGNPRFRAYLGYAYAASGKPAKAQQVLESLKQLSEQQYVSPLGIAAIHLALGEREQALVWLERAYQARDSDLVGMATDARLRLLLSDARFRDLLRRVGLAR